MITPLSKWLLYVASYKWIFILQIFSVLISNITKNTESVSILQKVYCAAMASRLILIILILLFIVSCIIERQFKTMKSNLRIKYPLETDVVFEVAFPVICYALTVLTMSLNTYGLLITLVIFVALGWVIVSTDSLYALPIFYFNGFHIYKSGKMKIITKLSKEEYALHMDSSQDGINARELVKNTFIVLP